MLFSLNPHHNSLGDTVVYCGGIMQTTVENILVVYFSIRFPVIITLILSKTGLVAGD